MITVGTGFIPARMISIDAGSLAESLKNHQPGIRSTGTGIRFQVKPESPAG